MKITRKIGGVELVIELTEAELYDAYRAKKAEFDREDIRTRIEDKIDDNPDDAEIWIGGTDTTAGKLRALLADDEAIAEMASELRYCLDNHDGISECLWMACDEVIEDQLM